MSLTLTAVCTNPNFYDKSRDNYSCYNVVIIFRLSTNCPFVSPDKSAIRFIPRENGVHAIDVKFNGCHIPGSPFNVRVGDLGLIGDPGMVTAHGPGLQGGITGTTIIYTVLFTPHLRPLPLRSAIYPVNTFLQVYL